jgi:hypothetical protein
VRYKTALPLPATAATPGPLPPTTPGLRPA